MYSGNGTFRWLSLGLLGAGAQRCADKGRKHAWTCGSLVGIHHWSPPHPTPSATHPPVSSPPVLLSSGLGALGLGRLGWPCHLGCPVLPLPASLCSSWWRGGCVYLGASEGLRGAVCAQRGRKPGNVRGPNRPFALRQPHSRSEAFYPYYGVNPPEHPREALRRALWRRFWALWPTGTPSRPPRPVPCPRRR